MFRIDYTVYEDDNNFTPAETYSHGEAVAKVAELLADTEHVRDVTIRREDSPDSSECDCGYPQGVYHTDCTS